MTFKEELQSFLLTLFQKYRNIRGISKSNNILISTPCKVKTPKQKPKQKQPYRPIFLTKINARILDTILTNQM